MFPNNRRPESKPRNRRSAIGPTGRERVEARGAAMDQAQPKTNPSPPPASGGSSGAGATPPRSAPALPPQPGRPALKGGGKGGAVAGALTGLQEAAEVDRLKYLPDATALDYAARGAEGIGRTASATAGALVGGAIGGPPGAVLGGGIGYIAPDATEQALQWVGDGARWVGDKLDVDALRNFPDLSLPSTRNEARFAALERPGARPQPPATQQPALPVMPQFLSEGGAGSATGTSTRTAGAPVTVPQGVVGQALQGDFLPSYEQTAAPDVQSPFSNQQLLKMREELMGIALAEGFMPAGRRRAAREALDRIDGQLFGYQTRERQAALDFGDLNVDQQQAGVQEAELGLNVAKAKEASSVASQELSLRASELGLDREKFSLELADAARGKVTDTMLNVIDKMGPVLSTIINAEGQGVSDQTKAGLTNSLMQYLNNTIISSSPMYQQIVNGMQDGSIERESGMRALAAIHDRFKAQTNPQQPQGFAEGGLVPPTPQTAMPYQPAMPQEQRMRNLYLQYAQGAQQRGIPAVPFGTFVQMATPKAQPAVGFAAGGMVPGEDVSGREVIDSNPAAPVDSIPAVIDGKTPAALDSGEFVIPEDVVRFVGVQKLQQLIEKAKSSMTQEPTNANTSGAAPAIF